LDAIQETSYPALADLPERDRAKTRTPSRTSDSGIRGPLLQTYRQTQAIRLYYQFYNVDTDRYRLADGYHQVMLSARELSQELPAKARTWVINISNHSWHGAVMNFVSKDRRGWLSAISSRECASPIGLGLKVTQPDIYYGEAMPGYRIVSTGVKEFDYPKGNDNVYTSYTGKAASR